jgi:protein SCO1/2
VKKLAYWVIGLLMVAAFAGLYIFRKEAPITPEIHGIVLDEPKPLVTFALEDMNGQPFTDQSFLEHWSLVFFGFTTCPDICPMTLSILNQAVEMINTRPGIPTPKVIFVSVDPERDTPEKIKQYVEHFNKNFLGVTGNATQLTNFSRQLGVVYEKVYLDNNEYLVDHSGSVALINRKGAIQAYFTPPLDAQNIAKDYESIVGFAAPCAPLN